MPAIRQQNLAKLASLYAGVVFGIYWIPLRALDAAGFSGIWASVVFNAVPLLLISPVIFFRRRSFHPRRLRFHAGGLLVGISISLYSIAFLYTEVVRTILLFYLTPIWGFLLARLVIGEAITGVRWLAMLLGLAGLLTIFIEPSGPALPLPRNSGDWMALISGFTWAIASLMLLTDNRSHAIDYGLAFFVWGTMTTSSLAIVIWSLGLISPPLWSALDDTLIWLIPIALFIVIPGGIATVYGPTVLNPGVVGLLFMTEISVATITAAILTDEPFGGREITGVLLISAAGLVEPVKALFSQDSDLGRAP